mgnify:FL=1
MNTINTIRKAIGLLLLLALPGSAAVVMVETFGSAAGWTDGDGDGGSGLAVAHNAGVGNAAGSLQGTFAEQVWEFPETDSFMINSAGGFLGNYTTAGITGFQFDLRGSVVPSDLAIRIWSGSSTFFYALNLGSMVANNWSTFTVPLQYTYGTGWQSDGEAAFLLALNNVTRVDVQVTRNGAAEQYLFLDNFATVNTVFVDPGTSAVPEPSTGLLVIYLGALLFGVRKRVLSQDENGDEYGEGEWA